MDITIVGAGSVGAALARGWASKGHTPTVAVRDPSKAGARELAGTEGIEVVATGPDAAAGAEVVVLAVPAAAAAAAAEQLGGLQGTIVVDPTNPIGEDFATLTVGRTTSAAEELATAIPGARVVKAFNTIGSHHFENPIVGGERASMFIAGDDPEATARVATLAADLGFDPVEVGPLSEARYLEPLAMLWIRMTYVQQAGSIGFKLLRD